MVKQIKTFGISRLTIGATSDFHNKVNSLITAVTPSVLHIIEQADAYTAAVTLLSTIVNRSTSFVATAGMKDKDKARDNFVGLISNVVRAHKTNPIAEKHAAAIRLDAELAPYRGIGEHEYSKQTSEVKGMLTLLALEENAAAIELLGLKNEVKGLADANKAFEDEFISKAAEATGRQMQTGLSSKEIVAKTNDMYAQIVQIVNAYAIVQSSDEIEKFIDDLNGFVTVYAGIAGTSTSGGSAAGGSGGSGEEERPGEL